MAKVAQGRLAGISRHGVSAFLGVRYAAPPMGAARWTAPLPAPSYPGIRSANAFGPSCPQPIGGPIDPRFAMWTQEYQTPPQLGISEDCLFANIWTPSLRTRGKHRGRGLPVMLFLHGGAYFSGSGAVPIYDGERLARRGIVVVTINYRLGALGFMAHPQLSAEQGGGSGNYGIQDQLAALRWLHTNIAAFGGDPARITLVGQSAGAGSILALMASPQASGLFRGAVIQSVPLRGNFRPLAEAERIGKESLANWGVADIAAARQLPVATLLRPQPGTPIRFLLTADGTVVPRSADTRPLANDVPILIGYTLNDLFVPRRRLRAGQWRREAYERYGREAPAFLKLYPGKTDREATDSAAREATARTEMAAIVQWVETYRPRAPVYAYLFSHVEPGPRASEFGAFHSSELPYEFDTLHRSPGRHFTATDRRVSIQFSGAIVNFIKKLSPIGGQVPRWRALTLRDPRIMEFGDRAKEVPMVPTGAGRLFAVGDPPPSE